MDDLIKLLVSHYKMSPEAAHEYAVHVLSGKSPHGAALKEMATQRKMAEMVGRERARMADMSNYAAFMSTHPAMTGHNKDTEQTLKLAMLAHGHNMQTQAGLYAGATQGAQQLDQQAAVQDLLTQLGVPPPTPKTPGPLGDQMGLGLDGMASGGGAPLFGNPGAQIQGGTVRDLVTDPGKPIVGKNGRVSIPYQVPMLNERGEMVNTMGPHDKPLYLLQEDPNLVNRNPKNYGLGTDKNPVDAKENKKRGSFVGGDKSKKADETY